MAFYCRPILLFSEFMPAIVGERTWEYQAFGHYDGIDIEAHIVLQSASSFGELFQKCVEYENRMNRYSTQWLFGFYEDEKKEQKFWKADYPILYLTLLQFKGKNIAEYERYLMSEEYLALEADRLKFNAKQEEVKIQVYYSLDNSELLLAIKCQYPSTGAAMINDLHRNVRIPVRVRNSYSILGVKSTDIEAPEKRKSLCEKIDMVELRFVEGKIDSVEKLNERIKDKLESTGQGIRVERRLLFGAEDESITIEKVPWNQLLLFYQRKTGELCNSNACSKKYAHAVSTKIMFSLKDALHVNEQVEKEEENECTPFCDMLSKKISTIYEKMAGTKNYGDQKNLMMFVNTLRKFEVAGYSENPFTDYNIYTIFMPFYMFLKLQKQDNGRHMEYYYDFMKSMNLRTQNFVKPDRVFSQIADFNMRFFDIPAKFATIYSAYIYYMKRALNTETNKNYEFLICPGENSRMEVHELYPRISELDRLFLVEMPEGQIYEMKHMFITLGHETAHFVGTDIRQRDEREQSIVKICARMVILAVQSYISYFDEYDVSKLRGEDWEYLEQDLGGWIQEYVNESKDEKRLRKYYYQNFTASEAKANARYNRRHGSHTEILRRTLIQEIRDMLLTRGMQMFSFIFAGEYEQENGEEKDYEKFFHKKEEKLQECIQAFLAPRQIREGALTLEASMDQIIYLVKECYADVMCILTLHLSLEDYLQSFIQELDGAGTKVGEIEETILIARIAVVCAAMSYPKRKNDSKWNYGWTDKEFDRQIAESSELWKLEQTTLCFMDKYIRSETEILSIQKMADAVELIYDRTILREIIRYLLKCRERFEGLMQEQKRRDEVEHVRRFPAMAQLQSTEEFFGEMTELTTDYELAIWEEIGEAEKNNRRN